MKSFLVPWLQRHQKLVALVTTGFVIVLALSGLSYYANEELEGPIQVPFVNWNDGVPTDCRLDPASLPPALQTPDGKEPNYLHTCGNRLFDALGREVMITGINWFGMETGTHAPHGLWSRNWRAMLDQLAGLGYNSIRLPFSNEVLDESATVTGVNYALNPDLAGLSSLEIMDKIVAGARQRGLRVVLDRHRPTSAGQTPLWYSEDVGEQRWISDWLTLARRYANNDTVIGFDLHNEPRSNATWGSGDPALDWRLAAQRAGNEILAVNPRLLIFVEGIEVYKNDYYWWGGHLAGVAEQPAQLNIPNRVVYSPHDYGPEVYEQGWFKDSRFPKNLPSIWTAHWGFIAQKNIAPVVVGEFGGRSVGEDREGIWQRSLLSYMRANHIGFFNWSLNPNSGDTGGLLSDDWLNVMEDKQNVYRAFLSGPIGGDRLAAPPPSIRVEYRATNADNRTANVSFSLHVLNDGAQAIDLSKLELRYWLSAGRLIKDQVVDIDYAAIGKEHVKAEVIAVSRGDQDSYVRITFDSGAPAVAAYQSSGEIMIRVHKPDWSPYNQLSAYSFQPEPNWKQADRIAMYRDGRLVWGTEPAPATASKP